MASKGRWPGTWLVICDVCGFEFPSDKVKKRWDGLIVCEKDFEHDHPQKHIRIRSDEQAPPFVRPQPADVFGHYCDLVSIQGVVDYGTVGCAIVGYRFPNPFNICYTGFNYVANIAIAECAVAGED